MFITKCDVCKKDLKGSKSFRISYRNSFKSYDFCETCGKPIFEFLRKKQLIDTTITKKE